MTADEWREVVLWVDDRWPGQWRPEQAIAFYKDLTEFDATDVWAALYRLYDKGREYAPGGSVLRAETIAEVQRVAEEERRKAALALPPTNSQQLGWKAYAMATYGREVGFAEAIRLEHAKLTACQSPQCDLHPIGAPA